MKEEENKSIFDDNLCYGIGNWHWTINEWADIYTAKSETVVITEITIGAGKIYKYSSGPKTNHITHVDKDENIYGFIVSHEPDQKFLQCADIALCQCSFCGHYMHDDLLIDQNDDELCKIGEWEGEDNRPIREQRNCEFFERQE